VTKEARERDGIESARARARALEESVVADASAHARQLEGEVREIDWRDVVRSVRRHMRTDRVNVAAQAFAYRWFLSIFPTIIALLGVATLVTLPQSVVVDLIHGVTRALPAGAADVFTKAITHAANHSTRDLFATIVASAVALWNAVSGMVVVEQGLDVAYGIASDRSFLAKRLVGTILLTGAIILGGAASALVVFGSSIGRAIKHSSPFSGDVFAGGWTALRWIVALVLVNLLFTFLYNVAPNRKMRWHWWSTGSLFATSVWALVSLLFSLYTSDFSSYSRTYGAFAGVAILIFWLYLTGLAILVGGEINAALDGQRYESAPANRVGAADSKAEEFDGAPGDLPENS
jgi:membrane protein